MIIRAIIAEDEPLASRTLRDFAEEIEWLSVVEEVADGRAAVEAIDRAQPDLLFLDVQMPELSGLQVLEQICHRPVVVFTTAYDHYAVAAFEIGALDYLVKPFGKRRFRQTLERVRQTVQREGGEAVGQRIQEILGKGPTQRLFARKGDRIIPIRLSSVSCIDACDDYVELRCEGTTYLLRISLAKLEERLDPTHFIRIHRSHIVNIDHIASMEPFDQRRLLLHLRDRTSVIASRTGSQQLRELVC